MSWDDPHQTAADPNNPNPDEEITATEWNNHVTEGHFPSDELQFGVDSGDPVVTDSQNSDEVILRYDRSAGGWDLDIDNLDGVRIVRDISKLEAAMADVEPDNRDEDDGGGIVFLAPPEDPEDPARPNTHFPDGVASGDRQAGVVGKTGVTVQGLTMPEFRRGPLQGGGQNAVIISAGDLPEGTATASGGDPRDWPTILQPRPKIDGGQDRAVASQFRNLSLVGEGKRVNGYYARNCDKGIVAGVNVKDTLGFGFGWSGSFSMHGYRLGSENCGSLQEGIDAGSGPFFDSNQNAALTPGVPSVYAQEGQDTLSRNVNVKLHGFFQWSDGDDAPTVCYTGPGGTLQLIGDEKYRSGSIIRNATGNTTVHAVVDMGGNVCKNWKITGGSGNCQAIIGAHFENDTELKDVVVEKLPEGVRFGNNPTNAPIVQDLLIQDLDANGTLGADGIVVDNSGGDGKIPPIEDSVFFDIAGDAIRYEDGNPGPVLVHNSVFDSITGNVLQDNRGNASQDSRKEFSGKANTIGGVSNDNRELAWVDLPTVFQNQFYDVISASDGDTISHTMDVEPDLVNIMSENGDVVGFSAKDASGVTITVTDDTGSAVTTDHPMHCIFRHASAMRQTRTDRTINS